MTHHGIDDRLGIARGSTSYYYRTRGELLHAAIVALTTASRTAFHTALAAGAVHDDPVDGAATLIADQLALLIGERRRDALARYALAADAAADDELRRALAGCLFSRAAARDLMVSLDAPDPSRAARDLISLLEGLLFDSLVGARALDSDPAPNNPDEFRAVVLRWLTALLASR